jgi:hypothetical protein
MVGALVTVAEVAVFVLAVVVGFDDLLEVVAPAGAGCVDRRHQPISRLCNSQNRRVANRLPSRLLPHLGAEILITRS